MNARFWIYWNADWIKVTLRKGERIDLRKSGETEEGFSSAREGYEFDGQVVTSEIATWERDCDGRHEWHGESYCHVSALRGNEPDEYRPVHTPEWVKAGSSCRDEYAEMSGY